MSSFQQYEKHLERSGPELVLETAARDDQVSDDEYVKLWKLIHGSARPGRRGGKTHALKMYDRDYARSAT